MFILSFTPNPTVSFSCPFLTPIGMNLILKGLCPLYPTSFFAIAAKNEARKV